MKYMVFSLWIVGLTPFQALAEGFWWEPPYSGWTRKSPIQACPKSEPAHWQNTFEPWTPSERKAIEKCARYPCKIKLESLEVDQLKALPEPEKFAFWEERVKSRMKNYSKKQAAQGLTAPLYALAQKKGAPSLTAKFWKEKFFRRTIDLNIGDMDPIRQVLAVHPLTPAGWVVEGVYQNHYFDSWFEWVVLDCAKDSTGSSFVTHGFFVDFDLFKKKDVLSRMARSKMAMGLERGFESLHEELLKDFEAQPASIPVGKK